ncbi:MAG: AbrB/MazE/SpoVT family DNA-binding domain-containing protein [Acidobacteria bacterium]|nr:AbrB/MazE/SpoVT family DNA-binding domain-containing protein [Acidobacteriota bacterium]
MNGLITTVSTKGQLVIPAKMRDALGLEPGDQVALTIEDGAILLRPVTERLVEETRGMFAGGSSMAAELQRERRAERW